MRSVALRARLVSLAPTVTRAALSLRLPAQRAALPLRAFTSSPSRQSEPVPARGTYKTLTHTDIAAFHSFLSSPSSLVTTIASPDGAWTAATADDLFAVNHDWMQKYEGHSAVLLKPKSTEEVSKIMAYCYQERIAVVPQGGNTGLVGGSTPVYDEVILSTEGMKDVRHFDEVSGASRRTRPSRRCSPSDLSAAQVSSPPTAARSSSPCPTTSHQKAT